MSSSRRLCVLGIMVGAVVGLGPARAQGRAGGNAFFPDGLAESRWVQFRAAGFTQPVSGVIYSAAKAPCCGVPVGGLDAGSIDIDAHGVYGFRTIINASGAFPFKKGWRMPRKLPKAEPILGLAVGGKTWVLASESFLKGQPVPWCTEPYLDGRWADPGTYKIATVTPPRVDGVQGVRGICCWGHYPVADLQYQTSAPVRVALRAWSVFLPGDPAASDTPAMAFEVHLTNASSRLQRGTLALNFPGPDSQEARGERFAREPVSGRVHGVLVRSDGGVQYVLGVMGAEKVRTGAGLGGDPSAWSRIGSQLPHPSGEDSSSSAAAGFSLRPGQSKVVRFILAWYAPQWEGANKTAGVGLGGKSPVQWVAPVSSGDTNYYTHMYATRYTGAEEVAKRFAAGYGGLLKRVLAWQGVIYSDAKLPVWLRDSLVNNLALIAQDSVWAAPKPPLGKWAGHDGAFGLQESPRGCPDLECIPCDWYGDLPIVYFFPGLARSTLTVFKEFQRPDGEVPFCLGKMGDLPDFLTVAYYWQKSLNGTCYVEMLDRLWQSTGDDSILREFYNSAKRCTTFTMELSKRPGSVIRMPDDGGMEWFEHGDWAGMAAHMGGLHLAQIREMRRMAQHMGDTAYAEQCKRWLDEGTTAMEGKMWTGSYYLNYWEPETGKKSDDVMGYQLDGQWAARFNGLPPVFRPDRAKITLQTIKRCNIALTPNIGAANFTRPDGSALSAPNDANGKEEVSYYGSHAMFSAEVLVLAMTYMYTGERQFGLDLAHRHWEDLICKQRHPWDLPNMVDGQTGKRLFGTNYGQCMMLWALPAAIEGQDLKSASAPGSLVSRVIRAAQNPSRRELAEARNVRVH